MNAKTAISFGDMADCRRSRSWAAFSAGEVPVHPESVTYRLRRVMNDMASRECRPKIAQTVPPRIRNSAAADFSAELVMFHGIP